MNKLMKQKVCYADEAIAIVSSWQKVELREKKVSVKIGELNNNSNVVVKNFITSILKSLVILAI